MLLALLQLLVEEGAGLGIAVVSLEAVEEELLVVTAGASLDGIKTLLLWLLLLLLGGIRGSASAQGTGDGTNGLVGNRGTGSKGHSLGNGGPNSGKHASSTRLLDGSGGGCSGCRLGRRGCRATGWCCRGTTSHASTSSSSLWFILLLSVSVFESDREIRIEH